MAKQALGIIEAKGLTSLIGWDKIGSGLVCGFFTGDVAAVKAGVDAGAEAAAQVGEVNSVLVIPRPHEDLGQMGPWIK
jgi:ethanolamine utilization protein EutM